MTHIAQRRKAYVVSNHKTEIMFVRDGEVTRRGHVTLGISEHQVSNFRELHTRIASGRAKLCKVCEVVSRLGFCVRRQYNRLTFRSLRISIRAVFSISARTFYGISTLTQVFRRSPSYNGHPCRLCLPIQRDIMKRSNRMIFCKGQNHLALDIGLLIPCSRSSLYYASI